MSQLLTLGRVRLIGSGAETGAAQPKRLALLAYLALAAGRGAPTRETLLALFWPELGADEGRRALRQGLHYLRRVLGEDVFVSEGDEVGVREGALGCDAVDFERMIDAGRPAQALALYRGHFLEGFHVDDVAAEYEDWVDRTRARLRRKAAAAAWAAAEGSEKVSDTARALELGRRACDLEPDQEGSWRQLMTMHDRLGDRAGARRAYDDLSERLRREFDAKPAAETAALAEAIRRSSREVAAPSISSAEPAVSVGAVPAAAPASAKATTSRRLAWAGIAAVVVLATGSAAYMSMRDGRAEPSLLAEGTLARKDRLLVADFANRANDSTLAAAITEALRVDLAQSPLVTVLTPRQVRTTLTRMERSPDIAVDDSVAREVALRNGVKAIVTGSIANVAGAYTVTVQLIAAESGEGLAAYRETAADSSDLMGAVDRVSKRLRHRIGESLRDLRDNPPLDNETTASLAALRKYTEGQQLRITGKRTEAARAYEEAVALDSAFAGAWVALSMVYGSMDNLGGSAEAGRRAIQHRDRLPFIERSFLVGSYAYGRQDYDTAIDAYQRLLERYPDNVRALNNLALIYQDRRQFTAAESLFAVAAGIDSTIANLYFGIHGTQLLQGRFNDARRTLDLIGRRFPDNPIVATVEIQHWSAQHRWEDAERHAEAQIAALESDTLALVDPFEALALMAMTQGRLAEAERLWRTHLALSAASGSVWRHLFGLVRRAGLELRYRNEPERALAIIDSAFARTPLDSVLAGNRPYDELARLYAGAGRLSAARAMATAADSNDVFLDRKLLAERAWTRGVIALAEGRAAEAEALLRVAADQHLCTICVLPDLARAYEATGKRSAATTVYERYIATPWFWRYETDALELGQAFIHLAELYDASGDRVKAAAVRGRLLQLWRRGDPELQPILTAARAGLQGGER